MKKILLPIIAAILLNACQLFEQEIDLDKIQNPDEVIFEMYPDFQLERMYIPMRVGGQEINLKSLSRWLI